MRINSKPLPCQILNYLHNGGEQFDRCLKSPQVGPVLECFHLRVLLVHQSNAQDSPQGKNTVFRPAMSKEEQLLGEVFQMTSQQLQKHQRTSQSNYKTLTKCSQTAEEDEVSLIIIIFFVFSSRGNYTMLTRKQLLSATYKLGGVSGVRILEFYHWCW